MRWNNENIIGFSKHANYFINECKKKKKKKKKIFCLQMIKS